MARGQRERPDGVILQILNGKSKGSTIRIQGKVSIGSDPGMSLTLADEGVSRQHVSISRDKRGVWIEDLGSTYGTFVGDAQLDRGRVPLKLPANLRFGPVKARLFQPKQRGEGGGSSRRKAAPSVPPAAAETRRKPPPTSESRRKPPASAPPQAETRRKRPISERLPRPQTEPAPAPLEVLAQAVIDLATSRCVLFRSKSERLSSHEQALFAVSVLDMFFGTGVARLDQMLGNTDGRLPAEVFYRTAAGQYFLKSNPKRTLMVVVVASRASDPAAGWKRLRDAARKLDKMEKKGALDRPAERAPAVTSNIFHGKESGVQKIAASLARQEAPAPKSAPEPEPQRVPEPKLPAGFAELGPAEIGALLQEARVAKGYSVREIAKRIGVDERDWVNWEKGTRAITDWFRKSIVRALPATREFLHPES